MEQPAPTIEPSTAEPPDNEQEVAALIARLGSRRGSEREEAEKGLRRLGMEAVAPLSVVLKQHNLRLAKRTQKTRLVIGSIKALTRVCALAYLVALGWHYPLPHWVWRPFWELATLTAVYDIFVEFWWLSASNTHRRALDILMNAEDLRVIGLLAECLEFRYMYMSPLAGLIQLLPRLQATDAALLNKNQRTCLYKRLRRNTRGWFQGGENEKLTLAILKGLEQIGDAEAVPYVKQAAKTAKSSEVREAAHTCLLFLTQRVSEAQPANTLLRATSSSPHPETTLLRASHNSGVTPPQQLLRTVSTDESP